VTARHAEIAAAGLAGLMTRTSPAQLGWSVRLHERSNELRMFGVGIWLWENGMRALEAAGALDVGTAPARVIRERQIANATGKILFRAEQLGVDIATSSVAPSVRPERVLALESGREFPADLVVVADAAFSRLRESVLCTASIDYGIEAGIRMLIDRAPGDPDDPCTDYWNDRWRLLYNPCTDGRHHIFLSAPAL
jgi:2-polyprenyl-6-methoxyphenol hydroxylase-like FAD-dependent oxidoreductase